MINQIYNEDCLETLNRMSNNYLDLTITSPPYNKKESKNQGGLVKKVKYDVFEDVSDEQIYQQQQIDVINSIFEKTKEGGSFFYNHKCRWENGLMIHPYEWLSKTKWVVRQEIIWNRKIAANIRGFRYWNIDERIYWLYKPVGENSIGKELKSKHAFLSSIWEIRPDMSKNKSHPCPFPIEIPARIIYSILDDEQGIVYDPYIGSGTTAVAANFLGKKWIGSDVSEEYIKLANERIQNGWLSDKEKFNDEIKRHFTKQKVKTDINDINDLFDFE